MNMSFRFFLFITLISIFFSTLAHAAIEVDYSYPAHRVLDYEATWIRQDPLSETLFPSDVDKFTVTFKNNGLVAWDSKVCLNVYKDPLRTTAPDKSYDAKGGENFGMSYWKTSQWKKDFRPVCVVGTVPTGKTYTFTVTVSIPSTTPSGLYYEDFSLGVDDGQRQGWIYANAPYGKKDAKGNPGTGDPLGVAHVWVPINVQEKTFTSTPVKNLSPTPSKTPRTSTLDAYALYGSFIQGNKEMSPEQLELLMREYGLDEQNYVKPDLPAWKEFNGNLSFRGQGRDRYQGHGLGMSQYGAFGAAERGYSAQQIIEFYFTGTKIRDIGFGVVDVSGYGLMDIEEYVAGLGEVPDKACGKEYQQQAYPEKYVVDNPNTIWDCWPEEAIKAQIIAARAWALTQGGQLRTDALHQVYKGGRGKEWAALETRAQVPTYKGEIIRAYYSSDNSQGRGSANHETIWSDFEGNVKNPLPYLRSVNDNEFAKKSQWTEWKWECKGFSYADIDEVLLYGSTTQGSKAQTFLSRLIQDIGSVKKLHFHRDPSGRVWKITLEGTKGKRVIAGWFFKSIWNEAKDENIVPDYIYSLTFDMYGQ